MFGTSSSIGEVFDAHGGRTSGFDYLRISLALGVILWHGISISYGLEVDGQWHATPVGTLARMMLPMFFALSGFLVAGSLFRVPSLMVYASHRIVRIFPALVVEITLSALILGPIVTTVPLRDYFLDTEFVRYIGNCLGIIYMYLPGVFETNMVHWVNISIWTVPYELECYIVLLALAWLGIARSGRAFILFLIAAQVALPFYEYYVSRSFAIVNSVHPRSLVLCFLFGVAIYIFRYRIPRSPVLGLLAFAATYAIAANFEVFYLIGLPAAYLTVTLGLTDPRRLPVIFGGDYSYGLYIYAFPIQQLQVWLFPNNHAWWQNMIFSLPLICAFAIFSWHAIEKPILMRRRRIVEAIGSGLQTVTGRRVRTSPDSHGR